MINKENFQKLLLALGFEQADLLPGRYRKAFAGAEAELIADFETEKLVFPEAQGLVVNDRTTCNFSAAENAVVFECVHRLLARGYLPRHLELEPKWKVGHGNKSGKADILLKDNQGRAYLIIECKTWGTEFKKAWALMEADGGQPLSYAQQEKSVQYVALYASHLDPDTGHPATDLHLVRTHDNPQLLEQLRLAYPGQELPTFAEAGNAKQMFRAWDETYRRESARRGLFDADTLPFAVGKKNYSLADLQAVGTTDTEGKYHEFATILRQHNVAGRENAFDKLVNLFLCKIVDEQENPGDLKFRWKGRAYDSDFELQDRLQQLYSAGMKAMLREDVTYITNAQVDEAFRFVQNDPDATRDTIKKYFRELKFFTNNDFAFIDVHNEKLFELNAVVLRRLVELFQEMRLRTDAPNQFLGDLFEGFLDAGVKQSEGQFFTPIPVVRFLLYSLPLADLLAAQRGPLPALDYACGAGHFLNELALELRRLLPTAQPQADAAQVDAGLVGIEKEYRLSKVAKVSAFMYGQPHIHIIHADGLAQHKDVREGSFRLLVANPPYSVKGFLQTLPEAERLRYALYEGLDKKTLGRNNAIETFFLERAAQLLAPGGVAAIVLPSSVLTNGGQYATAREGLLQQFELLAVAQLGSRTFGKTGTNTVTLFLRRRAEAPAPAQHYRHRVQAWFRPAADAGGQAVYQDADLLRRYCQHQGYDPAHYQTLLAGTPSPALLATEPMQDYRRAFEGQTENKKLRQALAAAPEPAAPAAPEAAPDAKRPRKKKDAAELRAELHTRWLAYLRAQEEDKLYYFVLASIGPVPGQPPRPVVIIKSPTDNKEQKQFLGYDWSGAKGNEGIQYLTDTAAAAPAKPKKADEDTADAPDPDETPDALLAQSKLASIQTTLYDPSPTNRLNPTKLNTYIERNFRGENFTVPDELAPYLSTARLVDMLDFSRVGFDKALSLSPDKKITFETPYPIEAIEFLNVLLQRGKATTYGQSSMQIIKSGQAKGGRDFDFTTRYYAQSGYDPGERKLQKGDVLINSTGVGTAGRVTLFDLEGDYGVDTHITIFRPNEKVLPAYVMYLLWNGLGWKALEALALGSSGQIELSLEAIRKLKIPVPPAAVQAALVAACEAVDAEAAQATAALAGARGQLLTALNTNFEAQRLENIAERVSTTVDPQMQEGEAFYLGLENIESDTGKLVGQVYTPYRAIKSLKTCFVAGDVLYGKLRPVLNKVHLAQESGICSTEILALRFATPKLAAYYTAYFRTPAFNEQVVQTVAGQQLPRTSWSSMKLLRVPVPTAEALPITVKSIEAAEAAIAAAEAVIAAPAPACGPARRQ